MLLSLKEPQQALSAGLQPLQVIPDYFFDLTPVHVAIIRNFVLALTLGHSCILQHCLDSTYKHFIETVLRGVAPS